MIKIKFEFKPQDLWIGIFWKYRGLSFYCEIKKPDAMGFYDFILDIWICIIPCLPLHIKWIRGL